MKKRKKKNKIKRFFSRKFLSFIQLLIILFFLLLVYLLHILPTRYFFIIAIILFIVWLFEVIFMASSFRRKKKTGKGGKLFLSKLLNIATSIVLIMGCSGVIRGDRFLNTITNSYVQTHIISVYVLKNSKAEALEDLKGKTFGICYLQEEKYIKEALEVIEEEVDNSLTIKEYDNFTDLTNALFNKEVDSIIAGKSSLSRLEANHESFEGDTREIYSYSIQEEIVFSTRPTDVTKKPFTIYLTGIDTKGDVSVVSRTDVNLLLTVNPNTKQILMISIPRDTQITLAMNGQMDKLTHTGDYGINEIINTIADFLDTDINYYGKTNFTGIIKIIDALGGVDVESPYPTFTTRKGHITIEPGMHHFDGYEALCFVRERYALPNGDFDRGKNQQRLLTAMLDKAMSPTIITNYSEILDAIEDCFETNLTSNDIKSLVQMQLNDNANWQIFNVQVSGEDEYTTETYSMNGLRCYTMKPDQEKLEKISQLIDKIKSGEELNNQDVEDLY